MSAKRKVRTFTIGRDRAGDDCGYYAQYGDDRVFFCDAWFERATGIRLKPGEKRRYKLVEVKRSSRRDQ